MTDSEYIYFINCIYIYLPKAIEHWEARTIHHIHMLLCKWHPHELNQIGSGYSPELFSTKVEETATIACHVAGHHQKFASKFRKLVIVNGSVIGRIVAKHGIDIAPHVRKH